MLTSTGAALGEDYFIRYSPDEIAWHTNAIADNTKQQYPLIKVRQQPIRGGTEIFVYMENRDNIFATTTRILDQFGLTIVDARVIASTHGYTLDTYIVLDKSGEAIKDKSNKQEIVRKLDEALSNLGDHLQNITRPLTRKQKVFPIQTHVQFSQDEVNQRTIMEVIASDRPGFLSCVGTALSVSDVRLHGAKIATYGSRVEDIFFITDKNDIPITDPVKFESLTNSIIQNLS